MALGKKTGGRKKGSKNHIPRSKVMIVSSNVKRARAQGLETPLDFLLRVMRTAKLPWRERIVAATQAAPYMHLKMSPDAPPPLNPDGQTYTRLTPLEAARTFAFLLAGAQVELDKAPKVLEHKNIIQDNQA